MKRIALGMALVVAIAAAICWQSTGTTGNHSVFGNLKKGAHDLQAQNANPVNPASFAKRSGYASGTAQPSTDPSAVAARQQVERNYGRLP